MENIIISFYAKGMTVSDMKNRFEKCMVFEVSTATISRITNAVTEEATG
ncbi:MAG TPA: transposase [Paludibacteraceae bacterium]|nr:transposase [Paludibacteraceae bacterium]HRU62914.1 transposase [Paludibacteraceae bacterium]